jgi:hypothetical protein
MGKHRAQAKARKRQAHEETIAIIQTGASARIAKLASLGVRVARPVEADALDALRRTAL